jgi:hypothetical protein
MAYRKINVNDVDYEYVIGKKFTKVKLNGKAFKIFENEKIGNELFYGGCWGSGHFYKMGPGIGIFVVTPINVKNALLGIDIPSFQCQHGTSTTGLTINPFDREIYGKTRYMIACPTCYENLAGEV